jgi:DNA-binding NarL/FixJ family response regulator/mRNA-degrading endonuclease RelE of RelBE toxin-antitoxin system
MTESRPRWEIILTRQAEKSLHRLSKLLLQPLDQTLLALAENPYPPESQPLAGYDNLYRLPVAEWRITYAVEEERSVVLILEIASQQQPERYRLEEELSDETPPSEGIKDLYQARANMPQALFKTIEAQFLDEQRFRILDFIKFIRQEKIRLLIVDDVAETRENLRKLLYFESDIEVVGATTNGEEAIQMAVEQQPDIVLMDIILPGINGITATEIISQQVPSAQVIMMSVHGEADFLRQAMMAGAREFLIKPFSSDELVNSIRRVYQIAAPQKAHLPLAPHSREAFNDLKQRILNKLVTDLDSAVDISRPDQARRAVRDLFERILAQENILLSRSEQERLFESLVDELELRRTTGEELTALAGSEAEASLDENQIRATALWFKFYKLGNRVEISLSVTDLSGSIAFYQKFGFKQNSGQGRETLSVGRRFGWPALSWFASTRICLAHAQLFCLARVIRTNGLSAKTWS